MTDKGTFAIEITSGYCLGGAGHDIYPGHRLVVPRDISVAEAMHKVRTGYARFVSSSPEAGPEVASDPGPAPAKQITHGDPPMDSQDPAIQTPRGRPRAGVR
jgi:hypothetical protein